MVVKIIIGGWVVSFFETHCISLQDWFRSTISWLLPVLMSFFLFLVSCHYFSVMVQCSKLSRLLSAFEHTRNILHHILSKVVPMNSGYGIW